MTWIRRTHRSRRWQLAAELAPWLLLGLLIGIAIDIATRFI